MQSINFRNLINKDININLKYHSALNVIINQCCPVKLIKMG